VVVVPEAWKFIPQGRGTPVKLAAEAYIRQAAGLGNYLWLDSQDIAGVDKIILKSVPLWVLGVQREANEIKRTLDNIPASVSQAQARGRGPLGLGEFFACYGNHVTKTYVQPRTCPPAALKRSSTP
jgi:DNA helicase HerA-like ATPase